MMVNMRKQFVVMTKSIRCKCTQAGQANVWCCLLPSLLTIFVFFFFRLSQEAALLLLQALRGSYTSNA